MGSLVSMALRNLARNRRRTLVTLSAFLAGVGGIVLARSVIDGLQREMVHGVTERMAGAVQIHRAGYLQKAVAAPLSLDLPADEAFLQRILAVPGVRAAAPRLSFPGMVSVGEQTRFAMLQALDPVLEGRTCPRRSEAFSPERLFDAPDAAIVDGDLLKALGARAGDDVALVAPNRDGALGGEPARVAGLVATSIPGQNRAVFVPLALAQRMLAMEGRATEIAVRVHDVARAGEVAERLRAALGPDYEVHRWDEIVTFMVDAMRMQNVMSSIIFAIFLVIVLLGVANTMLMSVLERTREIGTMMAVGMRRRHVLALVLVEALALGVLGGLLGAAFGSGLAYLAGLKGIPFTVPGTGLAFFIRPATTPVLVARVAAISALGAVVSGLYPALRASRLRPVQALAGR